MPQRPPTRCATARTFSVATSPFASHQTPPFFLRRWACRPPSTTTSTTPPPVKSLPDQTSSLFSLLLCLSHLVLTMRMPSSNTRPHLATEKRFHNLLCSPERAEINLLLAPCSFLEANLCLREPTSCSPQASISTACSSRSRRPRTAPSSSCAWRICIFYGRIRGRLGCSPVLRSSQPPSHLCLLTGYHVVIR